MLVPPNVLRSRHIDGKHRPVVAKRTHSDYLADHAKHFNTVEVDQWFQSLFPAGIRLPDPEATREYARSVPDEGPAGHVQPHRFGVGG
jgi:uncharacterized protein YecE (DUF72 family)